MTNYKQKNVSGEMVVYLAAASGRFENPYGGVPALVFEEVERTIFDGKLIAERSTGRTLRMSPAGKEIPMIDLATYEQDPDRSFPDGQLAYLLACAYIEAARVADEIKPIKRNPRRPLDPVPE